MKTKIIGIFIVTLLIVTALPVLGKMNVQLNGESKASTIAPILNFSPKSHDFGYVQEGQTYQTTFDIWNAGTGALDWHLGIVHVWLSPSPTSGTSTGEHDTVTVTISTSELSPGQHDGFVSIFSNGGDAYFDITLKVHRAPQKPILTGPTSGKAGVAYTYSATSTDPDGDQLVYWFDWGDTTNSGWVGPSPSGIPWSTSNDWPTQGTYDIRAKAKDIHGAESEWSDPLSVTMPRNKVINTPFLNFLEQHPHLFPLLRQLLGL